MQTSNIFFILILILFIFICLLKEKPFYESYANNNQNSLNYPKEKMICRINTIEKDKLFTRNNNIKFIKNQTICISVKDFKYFIDQNINKINSNTVLKICDDPYKSICLSTFNYKNFLNKKNISNVYAENWKDDIHPKLKLIPIGFESKALLNGNNKIMMELARNQKNIKNKPLKILNNTHFLIHKKPKSGSYNQRQEVINKLKNNSLVDFWDKKKSKKETWELHDNYSFEICAEGNGLDTHRFYEALLLNTIPIVKRNSLESLYVKFPCVIVDDWNEITKENCIKWKNELQDRIEKEKYKLEIDFWFSNDNNLLIIETRKKGADINYFNNKFVNYHINYINNDRQIFKYIKNLNEPKILKAIKMLSHPIMVYDIFRLVYLYYNNGIYIDSKAGINDLEKINNLKKSTYFLKGKNGITNWFIYSKNEKPIILKYLIDNIVSDILKRKENINLNFEKKVWETTGPKKIQRLLKNYNINIIEQGKFNLIYDRRYNGASWKDENSYHKVNKKKSIYL